ncbi:hypothetical protein G3570_00710 [Balneolaceae bacterium YR4-1]|uniref:Uncharacterized protein n=1 Tax=Halalkalibaculum roseum TaxID=2709311 RepID=A0A6M1SZ45_9BACT|nr:hypothetical protein [Halalkalibaculum roseum]NGP75135.1 hypothetical protein [Halalkalibaculum roseum]
MKRLISVSIICSLFLLSLGCEDSAIAPDANQGASELSLQFNQQSPDLLHTRSAPSLQSTIEYVFAGHLGITDSEGRLLVWEAEIHGDLEGTMKWWFVPGGGPPNRPEEAHTGFYEARWEVWNAEETVLMLAGKSSGVTALPKGKDGIWNGHGMVTETHTDYEAWNGRRIKEGGNVNFEFPYSGEGTFRIN